MVMIPAFCDDCGAAFPSGIVLENCFNITLSGNKVGPCPRCGGMGSVIDGVFNVVNETVQILSAPTRTIENLNKLSTILKEAAQKHKNAEEITEQINNEVPAFSDITNYIPRTSSGLVAWLTFILIAIQAISQLSEDEKPDTTIIINQSIEQSMEQNNYYPFNAPATPPSRNSPCTCGSGKRYKECCGKLKI